MERLFFRRGEDNLAAYSFLVHLLYVLCFLVSVRLNSQRCQEDKKRNKNCIKDENEDGVRAR